MEYFLVNWPEFKHLQGGIQKKIIGRYNACVKNIVFFMLVVCISNEVGGGCGRGDNISDN